MAIAKGSADGLVVVIVALLGVVGASATAGNFKVEASEIEIPVCRALPASQNQGESGADRKPETQATPWSETRLDMAQLELFNCLAKQEAAYRARGDQAHAAATRSRMQAVRQALCRDFEGQGITCPASSHKLQPRGSGCRIEGPSGLLPKAVTRIRIGMSKADLEGILGAPDYSPAEGLYYFSTGGDCPVGETTRLVSCGVVAEFRGAYSDETGEQGEQGEQDKLQSCWWGAIAE